MLQILKKYISFSQTIHHSNTYTTPNLINVRYLSAQTETNNIL